jgi:RNA polymerase sigma-54 factor
LEQISLEDIQPSKLAYFLAEMLDDNGYLKIDLAEVCKKFAVSLEEINQILVSLQRLEPNGIFARNIAECLSIQLQSTCLLDHAFKIILENLDLVAQRNLPKLSKLCGITADDVKTRIQLLQRLNPKPGATFAPENVSYKIPDVIIYEKDMDLVVQLNKNPINDLYFDKSYYNQVSIASKDKDVSFLKSNYKAANYLIHNLKKRAKTLWQVANIIAEKQRNFLLKGVLFFNPMTLGEVAEIMQMNESTISRAVANKYVKVPWGVVYEMKFFFSSSVASKISDNKVSSTKVKELIKQIIEQEDDHAFSDEELVYELAKFNVKVARRTVSKYRELLDIPKSHFRKKLA